MTYESNHRVESIVVLRNDQQPDWYEVSRLIKRFNASGIDFDILEVDADDGFWAVVFTQKGFTFDMAQALYDLRETLFPKG